MPQSGPKRTPQQAEQDLDFLAPLYCKAWTLNRMAAELSANRDYTVSHQTIYRDVHKLIKRWQDRSINEIEKQRLIELEKLNHLESTYWDAWQRSHGEMRESKTEGVPDNSDEKSKDKIKGKKVIVTRWSEAGDPRFLDGVLNCIKQRSILMGINEAEKIDHTFAPITIVYQSAQVTHETTETVQGGNGNGQPGVHGSNGGHAQVACGLRGGRLGEELLGGSEGN